MVEGIEYTQSLAIIITLYQTTGDDIEGKTEANLHDLLKFTTGLRRPPPLGLQENISIEFTSNTMATSIELVSISCACRVAWRARKSSLRHWTNQFCTLSVTLALSDDHHIMHCTDDIGK